MFAASNSDSSKDFCLNLREKKLECHGENRDRLELEQAIRTRPLKSAAAQEASAAASRTQNERLPILDDFRTFSVKFRLCNLKAGVERSHPMPATVNASEETISIGRIDIRFLLTGED